MRQTVPAAILLLAALHALASVPPDAPPAQALRGGDCLDPHLMRGFHTFEPNQVIVDAGRRYYLIETAPSCWNLRSASVIAFRGDLASGRVCGAPFDEILVRGEPPCRIQRMSLLTKEQYKQVQLERAAARKAKRDAAREKSGG